MLTLVNIQLRNFHQKNKGGFVMKIKVLLTLLIITLIAIAIISGCGGGSDTTHPASLITPTPDYAGTGDTAYITVKIKWPEQGKTGTMSTLSENGKEITTSMIPDTTEIIDIYIFDYTDDPNRVPWEKVVASGNIHKGEDGKIFPVKLIGKPTPGATNQGSTGPPPAILVKILAEAFDSYNYSDDTRGRQVAHSIPNMAPLIKLKVGNQEPYIALYPDLWLYMKATESNTERSIIANATGYSNDWDINVNLLLMYGTPFPVATRAADPSGDTSKALEGQEIKFKVIEGSGTLSSNQALTDANGNCTVHFNAASEHNIIESTYQYDRDDPNTIISKTCEIDVIPTPTPTPTLTPTPLATPTQTGTPTPEPTPTITPTPPPFPDHILGDWDELRLDTTPTGKTFTIEFTVPYEYNGLWTMVNITDNQTGERCKGQVIGNDSYGQIRWIGVNNIIMPNRDPYNSCFGEIYFRSGALGDNHTLIWTQYGTGYWRGYWRQRF